MVVNAFTIQIIPISSSSHFQPNQHIVFTLLNVRSGDDDDDSDSDTDKDKSDDGKEEGRDISSSSSSSWLSKGGTPSYSDNFLLDFHNQAQTEKQSTTNSLKLYNSLLQQEQAQISEWKDSFDRNGFADFTPPMTDGLNCLMVGDGVFSTANTKTTSSNNNDDDRCSSSEMTRNTAPTAGIMKLPWEEERGAHITAMEVVRVDPNSDLQSVTTASRSLPTSSSSSSEITFDTRPITTNGDGPQSNDDDNDEPLNSRRMMVSDPNRPASVYDCIVDQGLMDSVLSVAATTTPYHEGTPCTSNTEALEELIFEAATAIREHGIYVLVTSKSNLSQDVRKLLDELGRDVGLEWMFELDGISDDDRVVSVARRYCTGAMPPVGKLATTTTKARYYQI
jgi:hypothetical protein